MWGMMYEAGDKYEECEDVKRIAFHLAAKHGIWARVSVWVMAGDIN